MGGGGPCSRRRTLRRTWRLTTRPTVGRATFQRRRTTGCTFGDTRCLRNDGRNSNRRGLGSWPRAYASPLLQDTVATEDFFEEIGVQSRCEALLGDTQLGRVRLQQ